MIDPLQLIAQICGLHGSVLDAGLRVGLLFGLAAAGAAGSVVHCGPMCGPFVLGQVADRMARLPAARLTERCRIAQGLLLPYHLGRLTTYAALGVIVAGASSLLAAVPWLAGLRTAVLLAAAAMFLAHAFGRLAPASSGAAHVGRLLRRATCGLDRSGSAGTYLLGLALGLLPCGFLYAALAAAAGAPGAPAGGLAMLAFGLGTVPVLAIVGVAGGSRWARPLSARVAPMLLAVNALIIALVAIVA